MQISIKGLNLIKKFEGLQLNAYKCPAGIWTIGYGHTHQVKKGDALSEAMATEYLVKDIRHAQSAAKQYVLVALTQWQFDALVSLIFNIGVGHFKSSTLLKMLNQNNFASASGQFARWNKAKVGGKLVPLKGLTRRRNAEADLFENQQITGNVQAVAAPKVASKLTSKTNFVSLLGACGIMTTQLDAAKKLVDQAGKISAKGGDLADQIGGITSSITWPVAMVLVTVALFVFIIFERNKKVDIYGL
ncbi:MAG: lysozyme [Rhizobiales bacterium]|nr:lysozyme [Hyphomicrobiales bacterium]NRB13367.1 lysozyme [Hyphomicrobiales bacterium]